MLYSTSRLSRDRVSAELFERELRKLGVSVVYAHAGADSSAPEGKLTTIGVLQTTPRGVNRAARLSAPWRNEDEWTVCDDAHEPIISAWSGRGLTITCSPKRVHSKTAKRRTALEERLRRMRDLYELGDLHRAEYIARRDAINAELSALTPAPTPDLDQARRVLEDFTIFWTREQDPANKRQFLTLNLENVWLDQDRIVAVQPKPPFLPFFQRDRRAQPAKTAGVKYGSDGGWTRIRHHRSRFVRRSGDACEPTRSC